MFFFSFMLNNMNFTVAETDYWSSSQVFGHHWPSSGVKLIKLAQKQAGCLKLEDFV